MEARSDLDEQMYLRRAEVARNPAESKGTAARVQWARRVLFALWAALKSGNDADQNHQFVNSSKARKARRATHEMGGGFPVETHIVKPTCSEPQPTEGVAIRNSCPMTSVKSLLPFPLKCLRVKRFDLLYRNAKFRGNG